VFCALYYAGDIETARMYLDRGVERARADGECTVEATYSCCYPILLNVQQHHHEAAEAARRAGALANRAGNPNAIAWALGHEAVAVAGLGDAERAASLAERSMAIALGAGCVLAPLICTRVLIILYMESGQIEEAASMITSLLQSMRRKSAWMMAHQMVLIAAMLLERAGSAESAAMLRGATSSSAVAGETENRLALDELEAQLTVTLGPERFAQLTRSGEAFSIETAALLAETELAALIAAGD
jgi:hypothetical protein